MCPPEEHPQLGESGDPFTFTTRSGCLLVFDEDNQELLIFDSRGLEASLNLSDLQELARELRHPSRDAFRRLLLP